MKILLVAMSNSIHTARWVSQIAGQKNWEIHLFPSIECGETHPDLKKTTVHHIISRKQKNINQNIKICGFPVFSANMAALGSLILNRKFSRYRLSRLVKLIKKIKPDIIHSMEIQSAGYLVLRAKKKLKNFPTWVATNWGSDIYLFGRLEKHRKKINEVLTNCDYYSCECERDVCLAKKYGLTGKTLPVFPNSGGFDLKKISKFRQTGLVSERKIIMLKGYWGWAGRSLVGLRALERCQELLKGYKIVIHSAVTDGIITSPTIPSAIDIVAELFQNSTGIPVEIVPQGTSHKKILSLYGQARIAIGLSISDAISTSLLEAMAMGAFPIQSWTACANEWITDGKTGLLVPPEDTEVIEKAIRKSLTNDKLVDNAAKVNWQTAKDRLGYNFIKEKTIDFYKTIYNNK